MVSGCPRANLDVFNRVAIFNGSPNRFKGLIPDSYMDKMWVYKDFGFYPTLEPLYITKTPIINNNNGPEKITKLNSLSVKLGRDETNS